MQYDLFGGAPPAPAGPLAGRVFCAAGRLAQPVRQLQTRLGELGAEFRPGGKVTRATHYVMVGRGVPPDQAEALDQLAYHGYRPRLLCQERVDALMEGRLEGLDAPLEIRKDLRLTIRHYEEHRVELPRGENRLYTRELFVAPDTAVPQGELYRRLGDRGVYANSYIDDTTDALLVSDATLERLRRGETDDVLRLIERSYNESRAQTYRYQMLCESELLVWLAD